MNTNTITIKLLSIVFSAAALMATPALAATHKSKGLHHYASESAYAPKTQRSPEVYSWDGRDLGTDPDPNIRFQLLRDQNWGGY
jgi:hypothetical protein